MPPKKMWNFSQFFTKKKLVSLTNNRITAQVHIYTTTHTEQQLNTFFFDREKKMKKKVEKKYFFGFREKKNHIEKKFLCKIWYNKIVCSGWSFFTLHINFLSEFSLKFILYIFFFHTFRNERARIEIKKRTESLHMKHPHINTCRRPKIFIKSRFWGLV